MQLYRQLYVACSLIRVKTRHVASEARWQAVKVQRTRSEAACTVALSVSISMHDNLQVYWIIPLWDREQGKLSLYSDLTKEYRSGKGSSLFHRTQTVSGPRCVTYPTGRSFLARGKAAEVWNWLLFSIYCQGCERRDLHLHFFRCDDNMLHK
jgi:hypothetical protein